MVAPPRLRLPVVVQDVLLAAALAGFSVRGTLEVAPSDAVDGLAEHAGAGYLLLAGGGLLLALRRRFPLPVLIGCAVLSAMYYVAGYPDGPGWLALFVAAYTVAALGDGRWSVLVVAAVLSALAVVWLLTAQLSPLRDAGWVFFRVIGVAAAATLGESVRARQEIADEAVRRAEAAERDREQEGRRRADAERLRIAREVHDTVAHAITVINVHAGTAEHVLSRRPDHAAAALRTIVQTSARALTELRTTLRMLDADDEQRRPIGGIGQLQDLVRHARQAGLSVEVSLAVPDDLPQTLGHAVYRIVQESLTNVLRHAGSVQVAVSVTTSVPVPGTGRVLEVVVRDRGPGGGTTGTGRGLIGMQQRCHLLGGRLAAGPAEGGGFEVRAQLPLPSDALPPDAPPTNAVAGA